MEGFFQFVQTIMTIAKDLERTREDVKELKRNVLDLTLALQRLSDQIVMNKQQEKDEREKLLLQIRLEILNIEKRLPPI